MASHKATLCWVDVMGAPETYIEAYLDPTHRAILVSDEALGAMIDGIRRAGLFDEETTESIVESLQQSPTRHGLHDVTESGGGWDFWQDMRNP